VFVFLPGFRGTNGNVSVTSRSYDWISGNPLSFGIISSAQWLLESDQEIPMLILGADKEVTSKTRIEVTISTSAGIFLPSTGLSPNQEDLKLNLTGSVVIFWRLR